MGGDYRGPMSPTGRTGEPTPNYQFIKPPMTEDQKEYLRKILGATRNAALYVVVGEPSEPEPETKRPGRRQGIGFSLSDVEMESYVKWIDEQRAKRPEMRTAIGGAETFSFTPTTIGTVVKVSYLGEETDITDYSCW